MCQGLLCSGLSPGDRVHWDQLQFHFTPCSCGWRIPFLTANFSGKRIPVPSCLPICFVTVCPRTCMATAEWHWHVWCCRMASGLWARGMKLSFTKKCPPSEFRGWRKISCQEEDILSSQFNLSSWPYYGLDSSLPLKSTRCTSEYDCFWKYGVFKEVEY